MFTRMHPKAGYSDGHNRTLGTPFSFDKPERKIFCVILTQKMNQIFPLGGEPGALAAVAMYQHIDVVECFIPGGRSRRRLLHRESASEARDEMPDDQNQDEGIDGQEPPLV